MVYHRRGTLSPLASSSSELALVSLQGHESVPRACTREHIGRTPLELPLGSSYATLREMKHCNRLKANGWYDWTCRFPPDLLARTAFWAVRRVPTCKPYQPASAPYMHADWYVFCACVCNHLMQNAWFFQTYLGFSTYSSPRFYERILQFF